MAKLLINGRQHDIDVEESMPLLWAIRDVIGYTGTKFVCGVGLSGSCSIHIDGEVTRSCVTPISVANGKIITTIEGISDGDKLHPVQQA